MPDNQNLYASLESLFISNPEFEKLEADLDVFCPFEAIGMVKQEIRHAHFLSYIFDPNRPHGFGIECLRALMTTFSRIASSVEDGAGPRRRLSPLDVHLMGFESANVSSRMGAS